MAQDAAKHTHDSLSARSSGAMPFFCASPWVICSPCLVVPYHRVMASTQFNECVQKAGRRQSVIVTDSGLPDYLD